ncbi:sensor domain-containing diguanylate cyclase [Curvibacter sp. APW13]|uniref:sensor domain-containing diguanylate cyclase n=1 Tax=Curvibacter sp. APW13 TaxID=3077236 RepID=UPI0028E06B7E|nr:sensor domain-containing diguanylate cyclase [Curvibacter sp. APW13]MDT8990312.1 sensor domain-containing diguanylate cyclase [Curvibacter sp. APW13]
MPNRLAALPRISLRGSLLLLVSLCVAPLVLAGMALVYQNYQLNREIVETRTSLIARRVASELDRELSSLAGGLRVLSTSKALQSGDMRAFYEQANASLGTGIHSNVVLSDARGRQVMNTLQPLGRPLPTHGEPAQLVDLQVHGRTALTDVFTGAVTGKPTVALALAVVPEGRPPYSLRAGISTLQLSKLLSRQELPEGWLIAILDSKGVIAARSHEAARFIGQLATPEIRAATASQREGTMFATTKDGKAVVTGFTHLSVGDWSVVVGAPRSLIDDAQANNLWRLGSGALLAIALGVVIALWVGHKVIRSVDELNRAALQSAQGIEIEIPHLLLKEADAVALAILQSAQAMRQISYLAHHDPLTDLANRTLFFEMTDRQCAVATRHGGSFSLVALDLDGFKQVNDRHGHDAGDAVLREAARRIAASIRSGDIAARLGGDEFMVLLQHAETGTMPATTQRIIEALSQPYDAVSVAVSASAGVASFGPDGHDTATLMKSADAALYRAKAQGKNQAVFAQSVTTGP